MAISSSHLSTRKRQHILASLYIDLKSIRITDEESQVVFPESDESNECMCTHVPSVLDIYKADDLHRKS